MVDERREASLRPTTDTRILAVDDSGEARAQLRALLAAAGYAHVDEADSAEAAFRHLGMEGEGQAGPRPDLIVMDFMMGRINGIEAVRRIKAVEALRDIPIVMVTARDEKELLKAGFAAGVTDYVAKPYYKVELFARINSALSLKQERDGRKQAEEELIKANHQLERLNRELQSAVAAAKASVTDLAHCRSCHRVKAAGQPWTTLETFWATQFFAALKGDVCPTCREKRG